MSHSATPSSSASAADATSIASATRPEAPLNSPASAPPPEVDSASAASSVTAAAASSTRINGTLSCQDNGAMEQTAPADEEKEPQTATSSPSTAAATPTAALASTAQLTHSCGAEAQQLFADAQRLILGALSFADAEVHRLNPTAEQVKSRMQELAAAEAELRSLPSSGTEDQATQRAIKQAQVDELTAWLMANGGYSHHALRLINYARAVAQQPAGPATVSPLGSLCFILVESLVLPMLADQRQVFGAWLLQVDALFTRLCSVVPHARLSQRQSQAWLDASLVSGAHQLIPVLMRADTEGGLALRWRVGADPFLTYYCDRSDEHTVCFEPYLRLFQFGLDPINVALGGSPLSALQLARAFVRDHPLPAVRSPDPMAEVEATVAAGHALQPSAIPSVLAAFACHQPEPLDPAELQRREALHARFMHTLIREWLAHSTKVRSLLLDAAPTRLIPPLVDIVARYLDLEGVRAEPVAAAMDEEAESQR